MRIRVRMDESDKQASFRHLDTLAKSKLAHAKWAAKRYAASLSLQSKVTFEPNVVQGVMASYAVHPLLREFAVKACREILVEKGLLRA